jgi:5-methylcytosine-specific restriction endonuclease McrA
MSDPIAFGASGAIEALCTVLLDIAKTSPGANINDVMAQVKTALDRNTKLTNALQTDTRMLQINLGQSKGYQVLVEGNATAYIGDRYELDSEAVIKTLGQLLDERFQSKPNEIRVSLCALDLDKHEDFKKRFKEEITKKWNDKEDEYPHSGEVNLSGKNYEILLATDNRMCSICQKLECELEVIYLVPDDTRKAYEYWNSVLACRSCNIEIKNLIQKGEKNANSKINSDYILSEAKKYSEIGNFKLGAKISKLSALIILSQKTPDHNKFIECFCCSAAALRALSYNHQLSWTFEILENCNNIIIKENAGINFDTKLFLNNQFLGYHNELGSLKLAGIYAENIHLTKSDLDQASNQKSPYKVLWKQYFAKAINSNNNKCLSKYINELEEFRNYFASKTNQDIDDRELVINASMALGSISIYHNDCRDIVDGNQKMIEIINGFNMIDIIEIKKYPLTTWGMTDTFKAAAFFKYLVNDMDNIDFYFENFVIFKSRNKVKGWDFGRFINDPEISETFQRFTQQSKEYENELLIP